MVLFKRKPVQYLPQPPVDDDGEDVWVIPQTNEVFTDYEAYLQRMDFYRQRRFICEITGHSGMSFFDALRSETAGSREVESSFPDSLKGPVLRKVQFSTISRIDNLVDHIFEEFKQDFYPGEVVTVVLDDSTRLSGQVREKARFPELKRSDGSISRKAVSRYFVKLLSRPDEEALVDDEHIVRDRKVFTKQMLRSFIKSTTDREAWNGAPWLVKTSIAHEYRIDTNVPLHLQYGTRVQEKKEKKEKKTEQEGMFGVWQPHKLPELKPAIKGGRKTQMTAEELHVIQQEQWEEYQRALHADPTFSHWAHQQQHPPPPGFEQYQPNPSYYMPPVNGHQYPPQPPYIPKNLPKPPPPPPPPIKYPIEDLEVAPIRDGTHRPAIKYMALSDSVNEITYTDIVPGLTEQTVGLLLETWNLLNVYCQVLVLDSFTFDDFVDAIQFSSDEVDCELFVEIHCAILKKLVNSENDQSGAIQINLPDLPDVDDEDEESEEAESRVPTPTPEPEVPAKRTTRSSLNKVQFAEDRRTRSRSNTADVRVHQAAEMFDEYGWIERLRKRDFRNGGWQLILVGLLHQLSGRPQVRDTCESILMHLAPLDAEPTMETVRLQYSTMDINMRAEALQTICMLFLETKAVKTFLEEMSATMTTYRKQKIEHQRARKDSIATLKSLHDERRILAPEEKSPTPAADLEEQEELERLEQADEVADSEDEEPLNARALRRGHDRAAERKRKRDEEQERKEKAAEAKQNKGSKEYQKVLKKIDKERDKIDEAEEAILNIDTDLAEADCHRTRVLGKDRFCNRYWWFERNAMPHSGLPDSSTADAEYANGRIWVQGPDDMEREGFVDVSQEEKILYFRRFQLTQEERKTLEEGPTSVYNARQWGYYDSPEELEMLIGWLDIRGVREIKLKKELNLQRDAIIRHMEKRKAYLAPREDSEEPPPTTTRMTTRTKTYVSQSSSHRCLKWTNTAAIDSFGHRHVDPPPKPRGKGRKAAAAMADEPPVSTRGTNRQGKPLTRQGTRYHF